MFHASVRSLHRLKPLAASALGVIEAWSLVQAARMRWLRREYRRVLELEASKSAFLYLAAHELRTPLAVVRGYVEMVSSQTLGPVNGEAKEALRRADAKLVEMDELASQMVEMARLQEGHQLRLELIDVREVVQEAMDRTEFLAESGHQVVADDPGRPVQVMADRFGVRTILTNLIGNAIKYSPQGGEVRVSVQNSGETVDVSVSDQGIGIDAAELDQLFQPFTRQRPQQAGAGLGLGLYVAREIARAHLGDLSARANADRGSTFVVTLPAAHDQRVFSS
jgi:signal transduction histidine kinase